MSKDPKSQQLKVRASKDEEMGLQETKRPANLRANAVPVDGFVLSVDGKMKTRYESAKEAKAAGAKLKKNYPVIQVAIYDATQRVYTPVELQEQET
jgi:hypothetical protein